MERSPQLVVRWLPRAVSVCLVASLPLMILGNLNFLTAYLLLHGKIKAASKSGEVRLLLLLILKHEFLVTLKDCSFLFQK